MAVTGAPPDVVVIGGGPAGCTAAKLLRDWGRTVTLVTKPPSTRQDLAESIPPSGVRLFDRVGSRRAVDAAGFIRAAGNTVWWNSPAPRVEAFPDGETGYQVLGRRLDRVLLGVAETAGVSVVRDTTVRVIHFAGDGVLAETVGAAGPGQLQARWVLDCSGRAGVLGRSDRRTQTSSRTLAIGCRWRRGDAWPVPDDTHTLIESYADGWAWSIPIGHGERFFTVMVDPDRTALADPQKLQAMFRGEIDKTAAFGQLLNGASPTTEPSAYDASWYSTAQAAGDRYLLVGDAASFIDPLSSFGIKKAVASAYLAAVVTNTCLDGGAHAQAARGLYEDLEQRMFAGSQRQAGGFFVDGGGRAAHPFWADRSELRLEHAGGAGSEADVDALKTDPDVLSAFESIRRAERLVLVPSPHVSFRDRPVIGERTVVMVPHVVHPSFREGTRYLRGINLPGLLAVAQECRQVPEIYEAYQARFPPVILPDFLGALSVLVGKGLLSSREGV